MAETEGQIPLEELAKQDHRFSYVSGINPVFAVTMGELMTQLPQDPDNAHTIVTPKQID